MTTPLTLDQKELLCGHLESHKAIPEWCRSYGSVADPPSCTTQIPKSMDSPISTRGGGHPTKPKATDSGYGSGETPPFPDIFQLDFNADSGYGSGEDSYGGTDSVGGLLDGLTSSPALKRKMRRGQRSSEDAYASLCYSIAGWINEGTELRDAMRRGKGLTFEPIIHSIPDGETAESFLAIKMHNNPKSGYKDKGHVIHYSIKLYYLRQYLESRGGSTENLITKLDLKIASSQHMNLRGPYLKA